MQATYQHLSGGQSWQQLQSELHTASENTFRSYWQRFNAYSEDEPAQLPPAVQVGMLSDGFVLPVEYSR